MYSAKLWLKNALNYQIIFHKIFNYWIKIATIMYIVCYRGVKSLNLIKYIPYDAKF